MCFYQFLFFEQFSHFWGTVGIFQALKPALPSLLLFFSNSATCQTMPENGTGQFPSNVGLSVSTGSLDLVLGSCPRPRATALPDASTLNGNCPYFMHDSSGYWWPCLPFDGAAGVTVWPIRVSRAEGWVQSRLLSKRRFQVASANGIGAQRGARCDNRAAGTVRYTVSPSASRL